MTRKRVSIVIVILLLLASSTAGLNAQGPREGIVVRGHWTIDVRNPDGTPVSRTEFDNALHSQFGATVLAQVLKGQIPVTFWSILFNQPVGDVHVAPGIDPWRNGQEPRNIDRATVGGVDAVVLSGVITAAMDGEVRHVQTLVSNNYFTEAILPTPVVLKAEQIMQVKVTISFSSAPHPPSLPK